MLLFSSFTHLRILNFLISFMSDIIIVQASASCSSAESDVSENKVVAVAASQPSQPAVALSVDNVVGKSKAEMDRKEMNDKKVQQINTKVHRQIVKM